MTSTGDYLSYVHSHNGSLWERSLLWVLWIWPSLPTFRENILPPFLLLLLSYHNIFGLYHDLGYDAVM
jgi:hypothetical protein